MPPAACCSLGDWFPDSNIQAPHETDANQNSNAPESSVDQKNHWQLKPNDLWQALRYQKAGEMRDKHNSCDVIGRPARTKLAKHRHQAAKHCLKGHANGY